MFHRRCLLCSRGLTSTGILRLSIAVLTLHLLHGSSSAFQTLGVTHPRLQWLKTALGPIVAAIVFLGYVSIPVSVLLGFVE